MRGFEPPTFSPRTRRSSQAELHRDIVDLLDITIWGDRRGLNPLYNFHRIMCAPVHYGHHRLLALVFSGATQILSFLARRKSCMSHSYNLLMCCFQGHRSCGVLLWLAQVCARTPASSILHFGVRCTPCDNIESRSTKKALQFPVVPFDLLPSSGVEVGLLVKFPHLGRKARCLDNYRVRA